MKYCKNKIAICIVSLVLAFLTGLFFYSNSPNGIAESRVLDLTNQIHQAEQIKDNETLNKLLADEMGWSNYKSKNTFTKEQFIENIKTFSIKSIQAKSISTEIENNEAKVYFTMEISFSIEDGKISHLTHNYIYTFEKQNHEWKLNWIHFGN